MSHPARHHGQHHAVALQAQGLSACHGTQTVVDDVSLSARAGQWLAIVGPNGAGKSSLLRCLSGLMAPSLGSIALQGQPLARWPQRARARHLAWLGQEGAATDESISVLDTVALGRLPHQGWLGWPGQSTSDTRAIDQALRDTDMLWAAARPIKALSGGERQRVNLARALAVQADVLLLDEPVAHLDAPHQRLLAQVLQREATQGRCVISVLHELPLALLADQLAVMQSGRIVAQGHRDDPLVHRAIESVFDQAVSITRLNERLVLLPAL